VKAAVGRAAEIAVLAGAAGLLARQFACTWTDRNSWPFCSYNMFNRVLPERIGQPRVILTDGAGPTRPLPVYGLLPLEFFRVMSVTGAVYLGDTDTAARDAFTERMLDRLSDHPWRAFDEVRASIRPRAGRFTGLDLYEAWIDLSDYDPDADQPLHDLRLLYSYRRQPWPT
jgi:hypothetical protein